MESLGRENWRESHKRNLAPLGPVPGLNTKASPVKRDEGDRKEEVEKKL